MCAVYTIGRVLYTQWLEFYFWKNSANFYREYELARMAWLPTKAASREIRAFGRLGMVAYVVERVWVAVGAKGCGGRL